MKKTMSVLVNPRMAADGFRESPWLSALVMCLAFSCGLTMFSSLQNATSGVEALGMVSLVFDLAYLGAGLAAVFFIWQLKASGSAEKYKKAAAASMALGLVLAVTVFALVMLYFSMYSVLWGLTEEQLAEMEMKKEDAEQIWRVLPFIILSLVCNALEGASFLLFRQVLRRLGDMSAGKLSSSGIFTACAFVSALTSGMILGRMLFEIMSGGGALRIVFAAFSCLAETGIYAGMMVLCQGIRSALRGE